MTRGCPMPYPQWRLSTDRHTTPSPDDHGHESTINRAKQAMAQHSRCSGRVENTALCAYRWTSAQRLADRAASAAGTPNGSRAAAPRSDRRSVGRTSRAELTVSATLYQTLCALYRRGSIAACDRPGAARDVDTGGASGKAMRRLRAQQRHPVCAVRLAIDVVVSR